MESQGIASQIRRFGLFEVDLTQGRLTRQGVPVKLQEQPFLVLVKLLERPGEIVTREDLRHRLWPQGTHVDFEGSLNAALKRLRFALSDDADRPHFIETVPKRGYRFIAPVIDVPAENGAPQASAVVGPPSPETDTPAPAGGIPSSVVVRRPAPRVAVLLGLLLVVVGGSVALRWLGRGRSATHAAMQPIPARKSLA